MNALGADPGVPNFGKDSLGLTLISNLGKLENQCKLCGHYLFYNISLLNSI